MTYEQQWLNLQDPQIRAYYLGLKRAELCACGCSREAHDHFRSGSDCGRCGRRTCARFTPQTAPPLQQ